MNPDHGHGTDTAVVMRPGGKLGFECKHNGCAGYRWGDLRAKIDPGYQQIPRNTKANEPARTDTVEARGAPVILKMSDVQPEPVRWLWPERVGLGKLTLLAGDPGLGKSFITLDMAARVSKGTCWPDARTVPNPAGGVVLLSAEDDPGDTIRPRLDAAGADVARISLLQAVKHIDPDTGGTQDDMFCLTRDLQALELTIQQTPACRLVIIDPITAYLGGTDSHKNADIRAVLAPLSELARRHGVAFVAVTHLNKSSTMPAVYRAMGSLAFVAAARAVWAASKDKADPSGRRRLFLPVKNNLGNDLTGLAYRLEPTSDGSACVAWEQDPVTVSVDEALAAENPAQGKKPGPDPKVSNAVTGWLRDLLGSGVTPAAEVKDEAKAAGYAWRTVQRASESIGVIPRRSSFGGGWTWELPVQDANPRRQAPPGGNNLASLRLGDNDPENDVSTRQDTEGAESFLLGTLGADNADNADDTGTDGAAGDGPGIPDGDARERGEV